MDDGTPITFIIVGLILLAVLIGFVVVISCIILHRCVGSVFPLPKPIFYTTNAQSRDKILTHCDNILTRSRYAAVDICHTPSLSSCDTQNTNQSSANDFSTQKYDAPLSNSNKKQFRPRSQSLGVAVAQIRGTPRFGRMKPGRNSQSHSPSPCDTQNTNQSSAFDFSTQKPSTPLQIPKMLQFRSRSQSLGFRTTPITATPRGGWTEPGRNNLSQTFDDSSSSCHI